MTRLTSGLILAMMEEMIEPVTVEARPNYHIYLEFSDGISGEVDLSHLKGKGVFKAWNDYGFFEQVRIGEYREIKWDDDVELCPDSLFLRLSGKSPKDFFPQLRSEQPPA